MGIKFRSSNPLASFSLLLLARNGMRHGISRRNIVSSFNCLPDGDGRFKKGIRPATIYLCRSVTKTSVTDAVSGLTRALNSTCSRSCSENTRIKCIGGDSWFNWSPGSRCALERFLGAVGARFGVIASFVLFSSLLSRLFLPSNIVVFLRGFFSFFFFCCIFQPRLSVRVPLRVLADWLRLLRIKCLNGYLRVC